MHSIENVVRQEEQSLMSYVSRKAESDSLMAKSKPPIATYVQPGTRYLGMVPDTKVGQKLQTWPVRINGSIKAASERTPRP